jgi:hypothetical protein
MSDEPTRTSGKWLSRTVATFVVLASYETVHYATISDGRALGADHVCRYHLEHTIAYKPVPPWVECVFAPAEFFDFLPTLFRNYPWQDLNCGPQPKNAAANPATTWWL